MSLIILAHFLTIILFLFVWIILFSFIESYRDDYTRQRLFAVRDELFDLAADGTLSFDSDAYKDLRLTINGAIRFVHQLRLHRLIFLSLALKTGGAQQELDEYRELIKKDEARLSEVQKRGIQDIRRKMAVVIASHLIRTSFVLAPIIMLLILLNGLITVLGVRKIVAYMAVISNKLDQLAGQRATKSHAYDLANAEMFSLGKKLATG